MVAVSPLAAPARLIAIGTTLIITVYLAAAADPDLGGISVAALLVAGGFAFVHSTLQTWATRVAADLRATAVSLFGRAVHRGRGRDPLRGRSGSPTGG